VLEVPGQIDKPQAVGKSLLSIWPERDPGMSADRFQQHHDRLRNRAAVTPGMQPPQQCQRIRHIVRDRNQPSAIDSMHRVESADLQLAVAAGILAKCEESFVTEAE
jgi:hypothetical protein